MREAQRCRHFQISKVISTDMERGAIGEHHDLPLIRRAEVLRPVSRLVGTRMSLDCGSLPPASPKCFADGLRAECVRDGGNGVLTGDRGLCADFQVPVSHRRKPMASTVTAMPSTRMSEAEWQTRVDLAACYRLGLVGGERGGRSMPRAVENSKPNQQFIASCRRSPVLRESSSHQTLCCRRQSRANPSLEGPKFPASREFAGNFIDWARRGGVNSSKKGRQIKVLRANSLRIRTGNFLRPCREFK
jgi:hypothetical protein